MQNQKYIYINYNNGGYDIYFDVYNSHSTYKLCKISYYRFQKVSIQID